MTYIFKSSYQTYVHLSGNQFVIGVGISGRIPFGIHQYREYPGIYSIQNALRARHPVALAYRSDLCSSMYIPSLTMNIQAVNLSTLSTLFIKTSLNRLL